MFHYCERCKKEVNGSNAHISNFLKRGYSGKDTYHDCDLEIELSTELAEMDAESKFKLGTTLLLAAQRYEIIN